MTKARAPLATPDSTTHLAPRGGPDNLVWGMSLDEIWFRDSALAHPGARISSKVLRGERRRKKNGCLFSCAGTLVTVGWLFRSSGKNLASRLVRPFGWTRAPSMRRRTTFDALVNLRLASGALQHFRAESAREAWRPFGASGRRPVVFDPHPRCREGNSTTGIGRLSLRDRPLAHHRPLPRAASTMHRNCHISCAPRARCGSPRPSLKR